MRGAVVVAAPPVKLSRPNNTKDTRKWEDFVPPLNTNLHEPRPPVAKGEALSLLVSGATLCRRWSELVGVMFSSLHKGTEFFPTSLKSTYLLGYLSSSNSLLPQPSSLLLSFLALPACLSPPLCRSCVSSEVLFLTSLPSPTTPFMFFLSFLLNFFSVYLPHATF